MLSCVASETHRSCCDIVGGGVNEGRPALSSLLVFPLTRCMLVPPLPKCAAWFVVLRHGLENCFVLHRRHFLFHRHNLTVRNQKLFICPLPFLTSSSDAMTRQLRPCDPSNPHDALTPRNVRNVDTTTEFDGLTI